MCRRFAVMLLVIASCNRAAPPAAPPASAPNPGPAAPKVKMIASDGPEFEEMVKILDANPAKAADYKSDVLELLLTLDSVKEVAKDKYVATGKVGSASVECTFYVQQNLNLNTPITTVGPGDKVLFVGELASFLPGPPRPLLTIAAGAIQSVESAAK